MSHDPAFLFYSSDFLTGTMTMTDAQVGRYIRLLCLQHQKGFLTEKDILCVCKKPDADVIEKFQKNEAGQYYNKRLNEEAEKRNKYCESRRNNIKGINQHTDLTGKKRGHMGGHTVGRMENENENVNIYTNVEEFIEYRKSIKSPMTDKAIALLVNKLNRLSTDPEVQKEILEQSMLNNWKGIFALKKESKSESVFKEENGGGFQL